VRDRAWFASCLPEHKRRLAGYLPAEQLEGLLHRFSVWEDEHPDQDIQIQAELKLSATADMLEDPPSAFSLRALIRVVDADEGRVLFEESTTAPWWGRAP